MTPKEISIAMPVTLRIFTIGTDLNHKLPTNMTINFILQVQFHAYIYIYIYKGWGGGLGENMHIYDFGSDLIFKLNE